ncbi:hypothetical protein NDU88_012121 [Pleurodeles waltl]|uniref:Uncharacterized protein n=1 Tax=Pleurodeles waltl TaxID=8319 RepID=A0AAV7R0L4_PLEWA|nr:hypothetical protein NDU88_012121 [Pleurodeles waltl]
MKKWQRQRRKTAAGTEGEWQQRPQNHSYTANSKDRPVSRLCYTPASDFKISNDVACGKTAHVTLDGNGSAHTVIERRTHYPTPGTKNVGKGQRKKSVLRDIV